MRLASGDRLLLYTDGLIAEGTGVEGLVLRVEGLDGLPPAALVEALVADGASDDRTAVLVTYGVPKA